MGQAGRGGATHHSRSQSQPNYIPTTTQLHPNPYPNYIPIHKKHSFVVCVKKKENIMNIFLIQNNKNIDFYELGYNWDIDWDVDWDVVGV